MTSAPVPSSSKIPLPIIPDAHIVCNDKLDGVEPEEALSVDKDGTAAVESGLRLVLGAMSCALAQQALVLQSCSMLFRFGRPVRSRWSKLMLEALNGVYRCAIWV